MPDRTVIDDFLAHKRLAVVGVSRNNPKAFANAVLDGLREHGYDMVAVHRDDPVAADVDGVIVMVNAQAARQVVRDYVDAGVARVWLHKGVGPGAVSDEAVSYCKEHGVAVVEGACPLMFLEPVGWFHRAHRGIRRIKGDFRTAA
jgi:uncharacterized protein